MSGFKHKMTNTTITKRGTLDFSSDLERGAAPRSIADEKSDVPLVVVEIQRCEVRNIFVHRYAYWELHPAKRLNRQRPKEYNVLWLLQSYATKRQCG